MTTKKKLAAAAAVIGLASAVSMLIVRSPQETQNLLTGPELSFSIFKPEGCNWRLVFRQPPGTTNFITVVGDNIILPTPAPNAPGETNPAPGAEFSIDVITGDSFRIAWPTVSNSYYRVLFSNDMTTWETNPVRFIGTGGIIGFDVRLDGEKAFYKVIKE